MRPRISWMTRGDDRILEFLHEKDIKCTPKVLALNIEFSQQYVNERLRHLREADLVERIDRGVYQITDRGRRYLSGDLEEDERDEIENAVDD